MEIGIGFWNGIAQPICSYLAPLDIIALCHVCKGAWNSKIRLFVARRMRENLKLLVERNFNNDERKVDGSTFLNTVGKELFLFGSTVILALVSVGRNGVWDFEQNDIDMLCFYDTQPCQ